VLLSAPQDTADKTHKFWVMVKQTAGRTTNPSVIQLTCDQHMRRLLEAVDPRVRKTRLGDCQDLYTFLLELQQLTAAALAMEAQGQAVSSSGQPGPAVCTALLEELDAMGWDALVHLHPTLSSLRLRSVYDSSASASCPFHSASVRAETLR
jgi:hypothetical protein